MSVNVRPFLRRGKERWEVDIRFTWPDGSVFRERKLAPGTSKSGALKWGEARERELLALGKEDIEKQKEADDPKSAQVPTLDEFWARYYLDHCIGSGQAQSTKDLNEMQFNAYLKPHLGQLKLDEITDARVDRFKATVRPVQKQNGPKQLSPKTINNSLSLLRHMLKTAKRWKVIDAVPCEIIKRKEPKKEAQFHSFEAFEKLAEAARKIDQRAHVFVLLGGRAGMRRGEIIGLRWKNVDFARGVIKVVESDYRGELKPPKNGKTREVPMAPELRAALEAHPRRGERVLVTDAGKPIGTDLVRSWLGRAERDAGVQEHPGSAKAHRLRHTLLSHLALKGAPLRTIQEIAGHHALSMTARYLHLSPSATTDAMQLLVDAPVPPEGPSGAPLETPSEAEGAGPHKVLRFPKGGRRATKRADFGDAASS